MAQNTSGEMWHKEHHPDVGKATYRMADTMLCSAQDDHYGDYAVRLDFAEGQGAGTSS